MCAYVLRCVTECTRDRSIEKQIYAACLCSHTNPHTQAQTHARNIQATSSQRRSNPVICYLAEFGTRVYLVTSSIRVYLLVHAPRPNIPHTQIDTGGCSAVSLCLSVCVGIVLPTTRTLHTNNQLWSCACNLHACSQPAATHPNILSKQINIHSLN